LFTDYYLATADVYIVYIALVPSLWLILIC
jgi:hypothetical protein